LITFVIVYKAINQFKTVQTPKSKIKAKKKKKEIKQILLYGLLASESSLHHLFTQ
jgi:hypothetical protein